MMEGIDMLGLVQQLQLQLQQLKLQLQPQPQPQVTRLFLTFIAS